MSQNKQFNYIFKIYLLGDSQVGKTNVILRYTENTFVEKLMSTIGVDFKSKTLTRNGKKARMQLWDTAGQERFRSVTKNAYKNANAVVLLYAVNSRESFDNISQWATEIEAGAGEDIVKILVGNKCDVDEKERVVSKAEGEEMAQKVKFKFFESSALTSININEIFDYCVDELLQKPHLENSNVTNIQIKLKKKGSCCK